MTKSSRTAVFSKLQIKYPVHCCFSRPVPDTVANPNITLILVYCQMCPLITRYTNVEHLLNTRTIAHIKDKRSKTVRDNFQETLQISRISRCVRDPELLLLVSTLLLSFTPCAEHIMLDTKIHRDITANVFHRLLQTPDRRSPRLNTSYEGGAKSGSPG